MSPAVAFGLDLVALLALTLCVVGVVGSVLPLLPGAALSLAGVLTYWWGSGYTSPGPLLLVVLVVLALTALLVDWFGGAVSAKAGGASLRTTAVAAVVGFALVFVAGPVGLLVGIAGTVFALQFYETRDAEASARIALVATVGVLASTAMQALLTGTVLVAMLAVAFL
jgi:hypothetical protein